MPLIARLKVRPNGTEKEKFFNGAVRSTEKVDTDKLAEARGSDLFHREPSVQIIRCLMQCD